MIIKPFKAVFPDISKIDSIEDFFNKVKEYYPEFNQKGLFHDPIEQAFFIYQICQNGKVYTGIIGCLDVENYSEGHIKKHENTISEKEEQQLQLLFHRKAAVKPITLTYPSQPSIQSWIQSYIKQYSPARTFALQSEKKIHHIWAIHDPAGIKEIQQLFQNLDKVYIADGHHRVATTSIAFQELKNHHYNCFLCALFPTSDMDILDYNRILKIPTDIDFINVLGNYFNMRILPKGEKPKNKFELTLYYKKQWFHLSWKEEILPKPSSKIWLDAELLNKLILKDILHIENVRKDPRISYIEGTKSIDAIEKKVDKSENSAAFCLTAVQMEELLRIADAGEILPPKSTWFEPRMVNGMVVLEYK